MAGPCPSYKGRFQVSGFGSMVYPKANFWWSLAFLVLVLVFGLFWGFFPNKGEKIVPSLSYLCGDFRVVRGTEQRLFSSL